MLHNRLEEGEKKKTTWDQTNALKMFGRNSNEKKKMVEVLKFKFQMPYL